MKETGEFDDAVGIDDGEDGTEDDTGTHSSGDRDGEDGRPALAVRNLEKEFGSGKEAVRAVDGVSFDIVPGTVVGILGPNGAGKTTTIKSILGLIVPTSGTVEIAGLDARENSREAYRHVGAMLEGARNVYWKLTVRENLEFFAAIGGDAPGSVRERHDDLLEQLNLTEKADEPVNDLSRGMKQKVSLACALARDADVAFLDEPTLGLDVESSVELRAEIRRLAEQEDMTIVLSSHDMDVVEEVCDRVIIMNEGEIIADDDVETLVDVLDTHAYRIAIQGSLDRAAREQLRECYGVANFDRQGDRDRFEVSLDAPAQFYELMDELRETGRPVAAVESIEPDLEEVFLEITSNRIDENAAMAADGQPAGSAPDSKATRGDDR